MARRKFSREFKVSAVKLVHEQGYTWPRRRGAWQWQSEDADVSRWSWLATSGRWSTFDRVTGGSQSNVG